MKEIGKMKSYSIRPDRINVGDHVCRITLDIKAGPGSLPELARSCGELVGEQVGINLTLLQSRFDRETGEVIP